MPRKAPTPPRRRDRESKFGSYVTANEHTNDVALGAAILLALWAQPVIMKITGIPIGSAMLATVLIVRLVSGAASTRIYLDAGSSLATIGLLLWSLVLALTGRDIAIVLDPFTLCLVVILGCLAYRSPTTTLRAARAASAIVILLSTVAVAVERIVSPTLFGLIPSAIASSHVTGFHYNTNGGAFFVLLAMTLCMPRILSSDSPSRVRIWNSILVLLAAWCLVSMGSRGAILSLMFVAFGVLIFRLIKNATGDFRFLITIGLLASAVLLYVASSTTGALSAVGALDGIASRDYDEDMSGARFPIWKVAFAAVRQSPWTGAENVSLPFGVDNVHNDFLQMAFSYGVPGLLLLLVLLVAVVRDSLRIGRIAGLRDEQEAAVLLLVAAVSFGATHVSLMNNSFLWLVVVGLSNWRMFDVLSKIETTTGESPRPVGHSHV